MSKNKEFLKNFKDRLFLFGTKEGRQAKYDESKKSFLGMPLPEFGVSEFLGLPDTSKTRQEQLKKQKEELEKKRKRKLEEAEFEGKLKNLREGKNLNLDPNLKEKEVEYGPKKRAGDLLERFATNRIDQGQLLGYSQALLNQEVSALSEANRQRLETNLAFDRDSPTRMQERQLKAKTGEALLAEAVAKQATSAAQIGSLGTARTFGRGSTSIT